MICAFMKWSGTLPLAIGDEFPKIAANFVFTMSLIEPVYVGRSTKNELRANGYISTSVKVALIVRGDIVTCSGWRYVQQIEMML